MAEAEGERIREVKIEDEMRGSYIDYAMSVIVARALPDVRDGLKPVQRRILFAMDEMGLRHDRPTKKSARIVGEVMGKYHPHGDSSVYESMVRMAQPFALRYPLVDGQGNFGSVDNDPPAAMRYTEARMTELAEGLLADIDKDTVDFSPNFDDSLREPTVLPSRVPNLLINGSSGIAVGMATNIPPHNLGEICDAMIRLIENPATTVEELGTIVKGPDFPTGGTIRGREGIKNALATGRGRIVVEAKAHIEELARAGRYQIITTELPYQVNKAALIERIADLVKDKRIEGISDIRDESDRQGMRIVIELRREAQPRQVLNVLYKLTAMRSAFSANMLALVDNQPRVLNIKNALQYYIDFRREVIRRRSLYDLAKAKARSHILEGLKIALDNLDEVIRTIRSSRDAETARTNLIRRFKLSQEQAQAILDMQLRRLAALERRKIEEELAEVRKTIALLEALLASPAKMDQEIKEETQEVKKKFGDPRRTQITELEVTEFTDEDLVPHQEVVVILSQRGYIKRLPVSTYRPQGRGGRGMFGMQTREEDAVYRLTMADTLDSLLFFSNRGRVFQVKCHEVPDASRQSRGSSVANLLSLDPGERITEMVKVESFDAGTYLVMATSGGEVKKTPTKDFSSARANGLIAMGLPPGDEFISARLAKGGDELILVSQGGKVIRFAEKALRAASRQSGGVRGLKLADGDQVVAMDVYKPEAEMLLVTTNGYGKRTPLDQFPTHGRGSTGVIALKPDKRTGPVAAACVVLPDQEVMIVSAGGIVIRTVVKNISSQGRQAQGVIVMRIEKGDQVVSLANSNGNGKPPTART